MAGGLSQPAPVQRRAIAVAGAVVLAGSLAALVPASASADPGGRSKPRAAGEREVTYTTNADFDKGTLNSVNHDVRNQLQLNGAAIPLPYMSVGAPGLGTMVRINTRTGAVVGEYSTAPSGLPRGPARTTEDLRGNTWIANRDDVTNGTGSVTRVGLVIGGTRVDKKGNADKAGLFLKGPFVYNTCVDRNTDGLIATSKGLGDVRPWLTAPSVNGNQAVNTAADECVINYTRVTGAGTRAIAVDADNNLWVGGMDRDFEKLDGTTGQPIAGTGFNLACGGYGAIIDSFGVLWSSGGAGATTLRYDPAGAGAGTCLDREHGDYGLAQDPVTGEIFHSVNSDGTEGAVVKLSPGGDVAGTYEHGAMNSQGIVADAAGNVWVAHSFVKGTVTVGHLRDDGFYVGNVDLTGAAGNGDGPIAVRVDSSGKVWVTNYNSDNVQRIDPAAGPVGGGDYPVGAVDLTVPLRKGSQPSNFAESSPEYTIATGGPDSGTWDVVQDGGTANTAWSRIFWNREPEASEPTGAKLVVAARTANDRTALASATYADVTDNKVLGMTGRYLQVRVTLTPGRGGAGPVLSDLHVVSKFAGLDCAAATASISSIWPPDESFVYVEINGLTGPGVVGKVSIDKIMQDEPVTVTGRRYVPDAQKSGGATAGLRAEADPDGNGRVYHVRFSAKAGNQTCKGEVTVAVPLYEGGTAVDDGSKYNALKRK